MKQEGGYVNINKLDFFIGYKDDRKPAQCWGYILLTEEVMEYDEAVSSSFWEMNLETQERLNNKSKYEFLGEGYIVNHDIYGKLCSGETLTRFYKKVNNGK